MDTSIRQVNNLESMLGYFAVKLNWELDFDNFSDIEDITYGFDASDIGLKDEEFSKIASLRQLRPLVDNQPWGVFAIEFDSKRFEITALRKVLSGLIPKRRNTEHAMWDKKNLLFLCFWGECDSRTIGVAYFEDKNAGLPQIKINYCNPRVEDFSQLGLFENKLSKLAWPADVHNAEAWQRQWAGAFTTTYHQAIRDSVTLTNALADMAKEIQQRILSILHVETANGYVHLLYDKFRSTLIHDMPEAQFADMYAQTVAYGLFSARCMDTDEEFNPAEAIENIPNTNPFLKKLMKECFAQSDSKLSFDELELNEIVELLKNTDTKSILDDFNRQTGGGKEDPVIYFYEGFLNAYESEQKKRRGVYYTPQPVVNFIVRAVDDILKTEFGIADGLASTETKTINIKRDSKIKVGGMIKQVDDTEEVPAIQILDPATGTGTFLRQTILQVWENFKEQNKSKSSAETMRLWNEYVPKHLLPRLNGFELMMAPYAVAHMKLAMVLKETGYDFSGKERLKVLLTNSLEEAGGTQLTLFNDPLAMEAMEANEVKKNKGINVVIGNPPYSGESANKGDWIMAQMDAYKREPGGIQKLQERNPKWINDDYVKFIRYAQILVERAGSGIVAFINPHGFLDNPTFRGMRWSLLQSFDKIYVMDLHGNSNRKEICPDGSKDENVFDIQQGVSICIFVKYNNRKATEAEVLHADLWGSRADKYGYLSDKDFTDVAYERIVSTKPEFFFVKTDIDMKKRYSLGFSINELFPISSVGVVTAKDLVLIDTDPVILSEKVKDYYLIQPNPALIKQISYRPFDKRYIYYDQALLERGREQVMKHMFSSNIALITARSNKSDGCDHFFVSTCISEAKCGERTTQSAIFPLFLYDNTLEGVNCTLNLDKEIVRAMCDSIKLKLAPERNHKGQQCYTPIDLFDYIYAVLHSPRYRDTYKEFLKTDFPRVPYPSEQELFWKMVGYGCELRQIHLLESLIFDDIDADPTLEGKDPVEKAYYHDGKVYINKTECFNDVPEIAWNFYVGGYQPAQRWFKDRKGRVLSADEIKHYRKIIRALMETDRIMKEIDEVIEF